jgi:hypothetical protein
MNHRILSVILVAILACSGCGWESHSLAVRQSADGVTPKATLKHFWQLALSNDRQALDRVSQNPPEKFMDRCLDVDRDSRRQNESAAAETEDHLAGARSSPAEHANGATDLPDSVISYAAYIAVSKATFEQVEIVSSRQFGSEALIEIRLNLPTISSAETPVKQFFFLHSDKWKIVGIATKFDKQVVDFGGPCT